jgi:hypothetical protein
MSPLLLLPLLVVADPPHPETLRYLRPQGGKYVLESEITVTRDKDGYTYVSRTVRPQETMTLTVRRTPDGRLLRAELVHQKGDARKSAVVEPRDGKLLLKRDGVTEVVNLPDTTFFTTAPDWSDVIELARRYDLKKGGKQEFAGLWFHPTRPTLTPTFTVEKGGEDRIRVGGVEHKLERLNVRLRASTNTVWVFPDRRVCKILPAGEKAVPIVLQGHEEATRDLK